jgi:glycosyltransferase involved in cell wall biosynthesis
LGSRRHRIVILDASVGVTGALVSARETARVLRHDTDVVLVLPNSANISDEHLCDFSAIYYIPIRPLRRSVKAMLLYPPYLLVAAFRLRLLLLRLDAEVLLVNDFYLVQGALSRIMGYRGRILTWVRIDPSAFGRIAQVWLWASSFASDRLVAVSRHIQTLLPQQLASLVIYDPVSAEFIAEPLSTSGVGHTFVYLGNYISGKGQDVAIEALAEVVRHFPEARVEFYGGDLGLEKNRSYRRSLAKRVVELGLQASVTFYDFSSSPRTVLCGKFAALNLSRSESFSRTVLEASACGLPVIATRCGGPQEIVKDGETGFLIPVDDSAACAVAIIALCATPGLAERMGAAGRKHVVEMFWPDSFRKNLGDLLKRPLSPAAH